MWLEAEFYKTWRNQALIRFSEANFTSLSKMTADRFMSINQNMEIMNENLKQVTEWPVENEGEIDLFTRRT